MFCIGYNNECNVFSYTMYTTYEYVTIYIIIIKKCY